MSKEKINRKISELKESSPNLPTPHQFSKSKAWIASNAGPWDGGSTTVPYYWQARDWTGDEAANAELLDEMPHGTRVYKQRHWLKMSIEDSKYEDRWHVDRPTDGIKADATYWPFIETVWHPTEDILRKTAVAKAWLKWKEFQ